MAELTKAELQAKLEKSEQTLAKALSTIEKLQGIIDAKAPVENHITTPSINQEVAVVYMDSCPGYIKGNNFEYEFNECGQEVVMTRYVFDELAGKYHRWFKEGILAVSYRNVDVASAKGFKTDKEYAISSSKLSSLATMTESEIKNLWNSLKTKGEKDSLVYYYKRNFINEAEGFRDIGKVSVLNGLTNGGFARELVEISGSDIKYQPKDLNIG